MTLLKLKILPRDWMGEKHLSPGILSETMEAIPGFGYCHKPRSGTSHLSVPFVTSQTSNLSEVTVKPKAQKVLK